MIILSAPDIAAALAAAFTIGLGGYVFGKMQGYDLGERDHAEWCEEHHPARPVILPPPPITEQRYDPVNPWRVRPSLLDQFERYEDQDQAGELGRQDQADDMPPIFLQLWAAAGWAIGQVMRTPADSNLELDAATSPASVELEVAQMIERSKAEVAELIRRAEQARKEITGD